MSISGQQTINVGLPNESTGSDSLYTAFTKTQQNFTALFSCASPYTTFSAGSGLSIDANATTGTVVITNSGVTNLIAGDNITLSSANGDVTISANGGGGGGGGTVTSVGLVPVSTNRLTVSNSPIVSAGVINIDLATTGITQGTYRNPNLTVDPYGRVIAITNGPAVGTVTSVGLSPGTGIQVSGGPITSSGSIIVTNTGVTRITAGSGLTASSSNGDVTLSATGSSGTVQSVAVTSSSLTVSGSPIVTNGTINVELKANTTVSDTLTAGNVSVSGKVVFSGSEDLASGAAANLSLTASYFTTTTAETATLAAGTEGQIKTLMMKGDGGDMVITVTNAGWKSSGTGTITFNDIGDGCTLQYISSKWFCIGNNGAVFA
jgi:hypothetical protein